MVVYLLAAIAIVASIVAYDFKAWRTTGTGGTPPTWKGYWKIQRWGLWNMTHPQNPLDTSAIPDEGAAYLDSRQLLRRNGDAPKLTRWTLPQRQFREPITPKAHEHLFNLLQHLATTSPTSQHITHGPSKTEGGTGPAIYVKPATSPNMNPNAGRIGYEVAHVHPSENSLHVYLSAQDARAVIEAGWGQRFPVSWLAPPSWIMVYAPRDEKEVQVVEAIVRAAVDFAVGQKL